MSTNIKAFILVFLFTIIISLQVYIILNNDKVRTISDKHEEEEEQKSGKRVKRDEARVKKSVIQNPYLDIMTSALNNLPKNPFDLFEILRDSYPLPEGLSSPFSEYDYVVIGAGSAGSVVASRLTDDKNVTVLLIEPGRPENFLTDVPGLSPYFQRTDYTWQYFMEPQPGVCLGMINQRCFWPRGRAVGGTSVINYMIYTRGRPKEWDRIAAAGNYGWSYKDVLKYYIKNERANLKGFEYSPYRGRKGKAYVEFVPTRTQLIDTFLEAGRILGHPTVDYNAPDRLGFGYVQSNMRYGHRHSVAKAFLHNQKRRPNLHILPLSTATKILIDPESRRAYGVEYIRNNFRYQVIARREVILSAGPIVSPQLLMLSGVGPKDHLNDLGIPVIQDLPVGRTLYDHITYPGVIFKLNTTNVSVIESKTATIRNIIQYLQFGDSFISTPGGVEGIGYVKTEESDEPEGVPDIELICIGGSLVSDGGPQGSKAVRRGMFISENVFDRAYGSIDNTDTWSAFPMLLHPKSKGYLELRDTSIFSQPKLYGNYLTDPRDVRTFIAGIRHIIALASTEPFQRLGARLHRAEFPACRQLEFNSDEYWECAIRTLTATLHHQIATCRMGPPDDPNAVVDPELRVYGIAGLRVVDTSIIPRTTSAHTHAPGMMIGEKASDLIKITWKDADDHLANYYTDSK